MLMRTAGATVALDLLALPRLACRVAPVALGLALGGFRCVADHLLDGFASLACLALSLLGGLARSALLGFLGLDGGALLFAGLAGVGDGFALGCSRDHCRIVCGRPCLELLQSLLSCLGGPCEPLLHVLVL